MATNRRMASSARQSVTTPSRPSSRPSILVKSGDGTAHRLKNRKYLVDNVESQSKGIRKCIFAQTAINCYYICVQIMFLFPQKLGNHLWSHRRRIIRHRTPMSIRLTPRICRTMLTPILPILSWSTRWTAITPLFVGACGRFGCWECAIKCRTSWLWRQRGTFYIYT